MTVIMVVVVVMMTVIMVMMIVVVADLEEFRLDLQDAVEIERAALQHV